MKNAIKGALLSGLVFPGLGQLVLRQYRRGAVIILAVLASLTVVVIDAVQQALDILEKIEQQGDAIDITAISSAAAGESTGSGDVIINMLVLFVVVCWIGATIDAYRIGRKKDQQEGRKASRQSRLP